MFGKFFITILVFPIIPLPLKKIFINLNMCSVVKIQVVMIEMFDHSRILSKLVTWAINVSVCLVFYKLTVRGICLFICCTDLIMIFNV